MNNITPLFVYGPPKTGSTLLSNLLDGTNQIFVYPNEVKFKIYGNSKFRSIESLVRHYKTKNKDPLKVHRENVIVNNTSIYDLNEMEGKLNGIEKLNDLFDIRLYYKLFNESIKKHFVEINGAILIYYDMLAAAMATKNIEFDKLQYLCFKDVGGDFRKTIKVFQKEFPSGKIILLSRNPYAQFLSRLNYWRKYQWPHTSVFAQMDSLLRMNNFYKCASEVIINQNVLMISYEDIVSDTEKVVKSVARFLEIDFSDTLLTPTVFGRGVVVSTSTINSSAVFKDSQNKWESDLTPFQKKIVTMFTQNAPLHGYTLLFTMNKRLRDFLSSYFFYSLVFRFHGLYVWVQKLAAKYLEVRDKLSQK